MSGRPSCAFREPSTNSTREWTALCGWTTTEICLRGRPNRWCASITSRPLFIRVAESTVTLGPIDHRGWFNACSTVTWSRSRSGWDQKGPPLAVMISRRTRSSRSPHRHCQMALCSESMGRIPRAPAAFITNAPAITSTSFVARAISFSAVSAAMVGASARAPGMAITTRSHRGSVTIAFTRTSKSGSPACPWMTYSAFRLADLLPSVSPNSRSRSGLRSITSSVCWPMEPVAPRMATLRGRATSVDQVEHGNVEVDKDRRKQDRVQAVEHSAVARNQVRRVLDFGDALHLRLDQVADKRADADEHADRDGVQRRHSDDPRRSDQHRNHGRDNSRDRTLDGLVRADRDEKRMVPDAAADQQCGRVVGDDGEDREQRPYESVRLGGVEKQVIVERHADVERARQAHRPPAQALPAPRQDQESGQPADEGECQHESDVDLLEHCAAEGEERAQGKQQPGRGAGTHAFREAQKLPQRESAQDEDQGVDAVDAGVHADQNNAKEHGGAQDPDHQRAGFDAGPVGVARRHRAAAPAAGDPTSGRPLKRRMRELNSAIAAFRSSMSKSGHRVSVTSISA